MLPAGLPAELLLCSAIAALDQPIVLTLVPVAVPLPGEAESLPRADQIVALCAAAVRPPAVAEEAAPPDAEVIISFLKSRRGRVTLPFVERRRLVRR